MSEKPKTQKVKQAKEQSVHIRKGNLIVMMTMSIRQMVTQMNKLQMVVTEDMVQVEMEDLMLTTKEMEDILRMRK